MVKVYGASDDLVEVENTATKWDEIGCFDQNVRLTFEDGTKILVGYSKKDLAVWWIKVEYVGTAAQSLYICENEDEYPYSDVFEIDSDVVECSCFEKEG